MLLRNIVRPGLRHGLLPSLVDAHLSPECRTPSLHPYYRASTLLRVRPPLLLALVLGSSWVHHLEVSLRIEEEGSHVPHKCLSRARAAFMPAITRAVDRLPPNFVTGQRLEPVFDGIPTLSTRHQRFTLVRLPSSYLTGYIPPFPSRSPPRPLCQSSIRWFGPRSCNPSPRGRPSSLVQQARSVGYDIPASLTRRRGAQSSA